jgi:hypothetical protein
MRITASAISLNVDDVPASAAFATEHFGFRQEMADDGFVSLSRDDVGFNLVFLRTGLATFKPDAMRGRRRMDCSSSWSSTTSTVSTAGCWSRPSRSPPPSRPSPGANGSSR